MELTAVHNHRQFQQCLLWLLTRKKTPPRPSSQHLPNTSECRSSIKGIARSNLRFTAQHLVDGGSAGVFGLSQMGRVPIGGRRAARLVEIKIPEDVVAQSDHDADMNAPFQRVLVFSQRSRDSGEHFLRSSLCFRGGKCN